MPFSLAASFLQVRLLDILDILLVAILLYQLYLLIRGTGALNIFLGILSIYVIWWLVRIFEMELLTAILGQFISVGVLALIIVFQPEIRKFLLLLGTRSFLNRNSKGLWRRLWQFDESTKLNVPAIVNVCQRFSDSRTGALIVLTRENDLSFFVETGELVDARLSEQLLENIFFKNSPLHDGAVIITANRIRAARVVLPVTESREFPATLGLRHRAGAGITAQSDAISVIVSEQTGRISWCKGGEIRRNVKPMQLREFMAKEFGLLSPEDEKQQEKQKGTD